MFPFPLYCNMWVWKILGIIETQLLIGIWLSEFSSFIKEIKVNHSKNTGLKSSFQSKFKLVVRPLTSWDPASSLTGGTRNAVPACELYVGKL